MFRRWWFSRLFPCVSGFLCGIAIPTRRRDGPGILRSVGEARFGSPAGVGLCGENLDTALAHELGALLVQRRGHDAGVSQPLVPGGRYDHVAVVRLRRALDDAPLAARFGAPVIAEFPVGVAVEVEA